MHLTSVKLDVWSLKLKIGTHMGTFTPILMFLSFFVFELVTRTGQMVPSDTIVKLSI